MVFFILNYVEVQRGLMESLPLFFVAHQTSSSLAFIFLRCRTHFGLGFFSPLKKKKLQEVCRGSSSSMHIPQFCYGQENSVSRVQQLSTYTALLATCANSPDLTLDFVVAVDNIKRLAGRVNNEPQCGGPAFQTQVCQWLVVFPAEKYRF